MTPVTRPYMHSRGYRSISASSPKTTAGPLILLQVDQQLPEAPRLWTRPELAGPGGAIEVGELQDMG
jgi:hypothetical protein